MVSSVEYEETSSCWSVGDKDGSMSRVFKVIRLLIVQTFMFRSAPGRPQPFTFDEDELKDDNEAGRRTRD